ncbi:FMN-binding negative transcriptional regulator [Bdellovibrio sp. HCB337]|uniref:FMN-binding negative transcriptional regulator n=1 Tax=Bdellovibrio sp. HCB337 TaxID=3394358 RepID=UPI0039A49E26
MYRPPYSKTADTNLALDLIREYPLGLLISNFEQKLEANYLPFLVEQDGEDTYLLAHCAKANPQWRRLVGDVLVSFQGPQRYISPTIYVGKNQVPTWNYAAVQVHGVAEHFSDSESLKKVLNDSVRFFEAGNGTNWSYDLPPKLQESLESAIVGIRIKVLNVEAKFKLSQNRGSEDYDAVSNFLSNSNKESDRTMYNWMIKSRS